eukprot:4677554-Prymnesium_polylepis.1
MQSGAVAAIIVPLVMIFTCLVVVSVDRVTAHYYRYRGIDAQSGANGTSGLELVASSTLGAPERTKDAGGRAWDQEATPVVPMQGARTADISSE